jgi:hypothetical protein
LADPATHAWHRDGAVFVRFSSGHEVSFPVKGNPRLEHAAARDLDTIELSPFGIHFGRLWTKTSLLPAFWKAITASDASRHSRRLLVDAQVAQSRRDRGCNPHHPPARHVRPHYGLHHIVDTRTHLA